MEQFLEGRAENSREGKFRVALFIAGRVGIDIEVPVVKVLHPGYRVRVPIVEVGGISEGDNYAGQAAAINRVLADNESEIANFGKVYHPVRTRLSDLPDLPKELLEDASQLLSFVALEARNDPTRVGGGYTFAWMTEGVEFRIVTFEPFS